MNDFDDERLRAEFNRRAGHGAPIAAAHDAVLARSGRVRRRRAAVGSSALVALVVGGLLLLPRINGDSLAPADSGQPIPSVEDVGSPTTVTSPSDSIERVRPASSTESGADTTVDTLDRPGASTTTSRVGTTSTPPDDGSAGAVPPPTVGATPPPPTTNAPTTVTTTVPSGSTTTTTGVTVPSTSSSTTTPPPSVAPFTRTYDSIGGSIRVDWDGDSFTLLSVTPAAGFEAEVEDQESTRIRVRFRGDDDDSRIEVRVNDGQLSVEIS